MRDPAEFAAGHIPHARNVPAAEVAGRLKEFDKYKAKPIIVHCHHGVRSLRVTHWLRERGFAAVSSMQGGIDAWSTDVDKSVPRY